LPVQPLLDFTEIGFGRMFAGRICRCRCVTT
jgi:hypothetical protein